MSDIGTLLDRSFLRDILNGLSVALGVQCAALSARGTVVMRADRPLPPEGLPFDVSLLLMHLGGLTRSQRTKWQQAFRGTIARARSTNSTQSTILEAKGLAFFQCVAPVIADTRCVGFLASGKVPFGSPAFLTPLAANIEDKARKPADSKLAEALRTVGALPKARVQERLAMLEAEASAASQAATRDLRIARAPVKVSERAHEQLKALHDVVRAINSEESEDAILQVIVEKGFSLVGAERGTIDVWDSDRKCLVNRAQAKPGNLHASINVGDPLPPDDGIVNWVFKHKRPALVYDLRKQKRWAQTYLDIFKGTVSELAVPLLDGNRALGVLNVESRQAKAFDEDHQELLRTLADHAVVAMGKARLLHTKERQLDALSAVTSELAVTGDVKDMLKTVVQQAVRALHGTVASVQLYDDRDRTLQFSAVCDAAGEPVPCGVPRRPILPGTRGPDSVSAWVFCNRKPHATPDTRKDPLWRKPPWKARSAIHVPLLAQERCIGVLAVDSPEVGAFGRDDQHVLTLLANEAAVAVEDARHDDLVASIRNVLGEVLTISPSEDVARHRTRILSWLADIVWTVMQPRACSVIVPSDKDTDFLTVPDGCEQGIDRKGHELKLSLGTGLAGRAMRTGRTQYCKDVQTHPLFAEHKLARHHGLVSALSVPIRAEGASIGALNYYAGLDRQFSHFERNALNTICHIAGIVTAATRVERRRVEAILDAIGSGVTLIGIPENWDKVDERRREGDPDWNLDLQMPLLYINKKHLTQYAPGAKVGIACYKAFNNEMQRRPCWWCPTLRAMILGKEHTAFTHSPAPPKGRTEHFQVTATILKEGSSRVAATESTICVTRELEARHFSQTLGQFDSEDTVFDAAAECLGRGAHADCIALIERQPDGALDIQRVYTVDQGTLRREAGEASEWTPDVGIKLPPPEKYFEDREREGLRLFRARRRHAALRRRLEGVAAREVTRHLGARRSVRVIRTKRLAALVQGTSLLPASRKAIVLRLGSKKHAWGCLVLLDTTKGETDPVQKELEKQWCAEVAGELASKIENIRLREQLEREASFRRAIVEQAPVGVLLTDAEGTITFTNDAWQQMSGGDPKGHSLFELDSVAKTGLRKELRGALRGQPVEVDRLRIHTIYNRDLVLSAKCVALKEPDGTTNSLLISCWDMTDIVREEERLVGRAEDLARADLASGAVHELRSPVRAIDMAVDAIHTSLPAMLESIQALASAGCKKTDWQRLHAATERAMAAVRRGAPPLGRPSQRVVDSALQTLTVHDLEAGDQEATRLAEVGLAGRLRSLLAVRDGACHDEVVTFLLSLARLTVAFADIRESFAQVDTLVTALRDYSYLAGGEVRSTRVNDTIESALALLRFRLVEANVHVERSLSDALPTLNCQPAALTQLWCKLIENGIDAVASQKRRRRIAVRSRKHGHSVVVEVSNNGPPIPRSVDLTELGTRLRATGGGEHGGFGLYIARSLAGQHGGTISFKSQARKGTTVTVRLPVSRPPTTGAGHSC